MNTPQLIFMLEEQSAEHVLREIIPRILPPDIGFDCIPHRGKSDLQKSIPRKIRGWENKLARFVVLHDQDANDCKKLKQQLQNLCKGAGRPDSLIRIVCRELEAWYWGDLDAVQKAYPTFKAASYKNRSKYRAPDNIHNPARELRKHISAFQKTAASRKIPPHMNILKNKSPSFNCFISGVKNLAEK